MSDLEVIDAHTHMARSEEHGREYARYFLARFQGSGPFGYPRVGEAPEPATYGTLPEALKMIEATGIAHMNFLMFTWGGLYYQDGYLVLPDDPARRANAEEDLRTRITDRIRDNNEWALSVVQEHEKLSFFCGIDPAVMDERALLAEITDKTLRGALGVKMVPDDSGVRGNDRRLWPVYDYCESQGVPILSQTSSVPTATSRPIYFAEALKEFPCLKLICGHAGAGPAGEEEVAQLTSQYENVYGDVSGGVLAEVANGDSTGDEVVARLRRIGTDRLMYGTNFHFVELVDPVPEGAAPSLPRLERTQELLEVLKTLPLRDDEREDIASRNFRRLTGLTK